jgi:hypothetical protein
MLGRFIESTLFRYPARFTERQRELATELRLDHDVPYRKAVNAVDEMADGKITFTEAVEKYGR